LINCFILNKISKIKNQNYSVKSKISIFVMFLSEASPSRKQLHSSHGLKPGDSCLPAGRSARD
jgi:hypothetical protein